MLVLLFAGQTVAATFDAHTAHQQTTEHSAFDKSHQSHQEQKISLDNPVENYQFDCHHCCHCHAPASVYILSSLNNHDFSANSLKPSVVMQTMMSLLLTPEHRPPKYS